MSRFIQSNEPEDFYFVFVDSLTQRYSSPSSAPVQKSSSATSPFLGKSVHECYELLQKLFEDTGSDIDYDCFAVMDERSIDDDTLLLAQGPAEEGGPAEAVRVRFGDANHVALNFLAGKVDVADFRERAEREPDGVLKVGSGRSH